MFGRKKAQRTRKGGGRIRVNPGESSHFVCFLPANGNEVLAKGNADGGFSPGMKDDTVVNWSIRFGFEFSRECVAAIERFFERGVPFSRGFPAVHARLWLLNRCRLLASDGRDFSKLLRRNSRETRRWHRKRAFLVSRLGRRPAGQK
jgi:hypothetical protein